MYVIRVELRSKPLQSFMGTLGLVFENYQKKCQHDFHKTVALLKICH